MANNKTLKDGNGQNFVSKTTDDGGVNTPHVHVDSSPGLSNEELRASPVPVVGRAKSISIGPFTLNGSYQSDYCIGEVVTLSNAVPESGGTSLLHQIHLIASNNDKPTGNILIFDSEPVAATILDGFAFSYNGAEAQQVACIPVAATDWITVAGVASVDLSNLGRSLTADGSRALYAVFVANAFVSVTSDTLRIIFKLIYN